MSESKSKSKSKRKNIKGLSECEKQCLGQKNYEDCIKKNCSKSEQNLKKDTVHVEKTEYYGIDDDPELAQHSVGISPEFYLGGKKRSKKKSSKRKSKRKSSKKGRKSRRKRRTRK